MSTKKYKKYDVKNHWLHEKAAKKSQQKIPVLETKLPGQRKIGHCEQILSK
jgi:hypothetical protein